jgi:hypothetical protein
VDATIEPRWGAQMLVVFAWFLAGGAVEAMNTLLRQWSVGVLGSHGSTHALVGIIGGFVLRLAGTASVLMVAFSHDLAFGLAALLGYWTCRWVMLWRIHRRLSLNDDLSG